jgi:hypothetical protein
LSIFAEKVEYMAKLIETDISALVPDDKNFNKGTQYGQHLIEESLRKFGAGRSGLLDRNNRIIAGNKFTENAGAIGMSKVIIVETDGTAPVYVKRTDIDLDTAKGREMALADNATGKANLDWDTDTIKEQAEAWDIKPDNWGVEIPDWEQTQDPKEDKDLSDKVGEAYEIVVSCDGEADQERLFNEFKERGLKCRVLTL